MLVSRVWMILVLMLSPRPRITSYPFIHTVNAKVDVIVEFAHVCSFNKGCNTEPKNITEIEDAECCQDCSCDAFCSPLGVCCPHIDQFTLETKYFNQSDPLVQLFSNHSEYRNKTFLPDTFYPCVMLDDLLNKARGLGFPITQTTALRVITDCPSINESLEYPSCQVPETLEDFRLVVDERGLVYKNEQCAKCNGVTITTAWSLQPSCNWLYGEHFESFDELNAFILRFCKLESHPPMSRNISDFAQCFSPLTPPLGACHVTYDGVFNTGKGSLRGSSFTAILDNRKEKKEDTRAAKCASNELWDQYSDNCRRLFCPPLMIPSLGQCVDMFQSYDGFDLHVLFKAINWKDSFGIYDAQSLIIGLEDSYFDQCRVCMADFELSRNIQGDEGIYLRIAFTTSELCSLDFILDVLRHASHTLINIEVYGISLKIELHFEKVYRRYSLFNLMNTKCAGGVSLTKGLLQHCPSIEVPNHISSESKVKNVYFREENDEDKMKVICVQDYIEFMEMYAENGGQGTNCPAMLLKLWVLFICCVLYDN